MSVGSDSEREDEVSGAADGEENESLADDDVMQQPAEDPSAVVAFHLFGVKLSHLVMVYKNLSICVP